MPLPLIVGAVALAAKGVQTYNANKKRKLTAEQQAALAAEQERKAKVAQGVQILRQDQSVVDPNADVERSLYAGGGDPYTQIAGSVIDTASSFADLNSTKRELADQLELEKNRVGINPIDSMFTRSAEKDALLNNPSNPDAYANGGGIKYNSSNTAVIKAGTHESGDDLEFARPNGTKAKVEGEEGIRDTGNEVQIFSNRIANPVTGQTLASDFSNLSSLKGNLEDAKKETGNRVTANTKDRQITGIDSTLDSMYSTQEEVKKLEGNQQKNGVYARGGNPYDEGTQAEQYAEWEDNNKFMSTKLKGIDAEVEVEGTVDSKNVVNKTTAAKYPAKEGKGFLKRLTSTDAVNVGATGLTLLDNIYNAKVLNDVSNTKRADPRYVSKVDLDTEFNVEGHEAAAKSTLDTFYKNVDKNTSSSVVGLNVKMAATADTIKQLNKVHDTKQKFETEMANKEKLANLNVESTNVGIYNQNINQEQNRQDDIKFQKAANFTNAIDDITSGIVRARDITGKRETFNAQQRSQSDTGVVVKNIAAGDYSEISNTEATNRLDEAFNAGNLSTKDYIKAIGDYNKHSKRGKITGITEASLNARKANR